MTSGADPASSPPSAPRRVLLAVGAAAGLLGLVELLWRATGDDSGRVDYTAHVNALVAAHQPDGCNGWPLVVEAAERASRVSDDLLEQWTVRHAHELDEMPYIPAMMERPGSELETQLVAELLDAIDQRGAFDLLDEAALCPRMVRTVEGSPLILITLEHRGPIRALARACTASMRTAAERNDAAGVIAAMERGLTLSRATASQAFVIDRLVAVSIEAHLLDELRTVLLERHFDVEQCRTMLAVLERQRWIAPITLAVESERVSILDLIQEVYTNDGHGDGRLQPARFDELALTAPGDMSWRLAAIGQSSRAATVAHLHSFCDALRTTAELNTLQRATASSASAAALAQLDWQDAFLQTILPAIEKAFTREDQRHAAVEATRIAIALEGFRAEHGRYPNALVELAGHLLLELPADPTHGGPFIYRTLPAGSALPYVLYSTGVDGVDDSAAATAPPEIIHPVSKSGEDAWFRCWRE